MLQELCMLMTSQMHIISVMMFMWCCLFILLTYNGVYSTDMGLVFGRIQSGLKLAGKLLGLDKATEVAQLVTESFGKQTRKGDNQENSSIFSKFLKLLGLESKKISAIAINAIVFVAQLISSTLSRPPPAILTHGRSLRPGTPLDWILQSDNSKIKELIEVSKDPKLPEKIIEFLKERTTDEETGCVQLLVCKTTPFLLGMQKAVEEKVTGSKKSNGAAGMFKYLPTMKEVQKFGDECENKYPYCILN